MPRFYFHISNREGCIIDEEGSHHESVNAALQTCLDAARQLIGADIAEGTIDLFQAIVLADETGGVIHEQPFISALHFRHCEDQLEFRRLLHRSQLRRRPAAAVAPPV